MLKFELKGESLVILTILMLSLGLRQKGGGQDGRVLIIGSSEESVGKWGRFFVFLIILTHRF